MVNFLVRRVIINPSKKKGNQPCVCVCGYEKTQTTGQFRRNICRGVVRHRRARCALWFSQETTGSWSPPVSDEPADHGACFRQGSCILKTCIQPRKRGEIIWRPVTFRSTTRQTHMVFQGRSRPSNARSNTVNPLVITSLKPIFLWHKASDWPTLVSAKLLSFPKRDLSQMRGSVRPHEPVRKALLRSGAKLISANSVSAKRRQTHWRMNYWNDWEKFSRMERQKCWCFSSSSETNIRQQKQPFTAHSL